MSSVLVLTGAAIGATYLATMAFVAFQLRRAPLVTDLDESEAGAMSQDAEAASVVEADPADLAPVNIRAPRVVWKHSRRARMVRHDSAADALLRQAERGGMTHAA